MIVTCTRQDDVWDLINGGWRKTKRSILQGLSRRSSWLGCHWIERQTSKFAFTCSIGSLSNRIGTRYGLLKYRANAIFQGLPKKRRVQCDVGPMLVVLAPATKDTAQAESTWCWNHGLSTRHYSYFLLMFLSVSSLQDTPWKCSIWGCIDCIYDNSGKNVACQQLRGYTKSYDLCPLASTSSLG